MAHTGILENIKHWYAKHKESYRWITSMENLKFNLVSLTYVSVVVLPALSAIKWNKKMYKGH